MDNSKAANFAGAFLSGSTIWLPDDAELSPASDVDLMVVTTDTDPPPKLGKFRWRGVLIEVTYLSWGQLPSAEVILGSHHLAGGFRKNTVVADPAGRLTRLQAVTAVEYARRPWVRRRCRSAEQKVVDGLGALDPSAASHDRVTALIFPAGVTTHVLLTAGLRNPTVRLRYPAARELLADYGHLEHYEELLRLLGCADITPSRAEHHLRAMTEAFDATVPLARTPFPFASDITVTARPVAVDGGRDLIAKGLHRESIFWIAATYARCLKILATAPFAAGPGDRRHRPGSTVLLQRTHRPVTGRPPDAADGDARTRRRGERRWRRPTFTR
ncbi:hypothetical protein [Streptosporangium sp. NPDC051022]|uniref:hypothetical protein n=1 Tax=Streptosporangium sp. NPDC051022 TaxID=3155752 RepID=UPI0034407D37